MSAIMFLSAYICGWLPTMCKASEKVMNLIGVFGAGMLVGAAIIVVIPEAVKVIIEATFDPNDPHGEVVSEDVAFNIGTAIIAGFTIMLIIDEVFKIIKEKCSTKKDSRFEHTALRQFKEEKRNLLTENSPSVNSIDTSPRPSRFVSASPILQQRMGENAVLIPRNEETGKNLSLIHI